MDQTSNVPDQRAANGFHWGIIALAGFLICSASGEADVLNPAKFAGHDWTVDIEMVAKFKLGPSNARGASSIYRKSWQKWEYEQSWI